MHGSFDRDERFDDEERRYRLIYQLSSEMNLPTTTLNSLLIPEKRKVKGANGLIFIGKKSVKSIKENQIVNH